MTKEERVAHANEISNQYVPRISPDETEIMKEIKELPIQDIITIISNANYALKKGMFHNINEEALKAGEPDAKRFADAIEYTKQILIGRLKTADALWTVTDKVTQLPFIDNYNEVWVYSDKELADACIEYCSKQYRMFSLTEIAKDDIVKFFGQTAYLNGAESFNVDYGGYAQIHLKAEQLVDKPDFSNTPAINTPVTNPVFLRSLIKLKQEMYYRVDYEGKKEKLHSLEDDMRHALHQARFLIPVKGMDQLAKNVEMSKKPDSDKQPDLPKTRIQIPVLSKMDGEKEISLMPVFTDWEEFRKKFSDKEWGGWVWTAKDLVSTPYHMVVINAGSLAFEISGEVIQKMLDIDKSETASATPPEHRKSDGEEAVKTALNLLNRKSSDQLPDTLTEFMDAPRNLSKEDFLQKYGAETIFWFIGFDEETGRWILHWSPKFKDVISEGVYFTYEDACAALVMRSVTCPMSHYVIRRGTVKELFARVSWNIRFIRNDGKVLTIWRNGDVLSASVYTQDELMANFVSKYGGKTVIAEDFSDLNIEDLVVWTLAAPDTKDKAGKWNYRRYYEYDREGLYHGENCYHVFSTYEEAAKEIEPGFYPQKVCLYQELRKYPDRPHVFYCDGTEILFVPKEMAEAKNVVEDVKKDSEYARIEADMTSYLEETDMSKSRIVQTIEKLKKYQDIFEAFHSYIMSTEYPETPVIEGYNPKTLHEKVGSKLSPVGIMNYLIYLREDPQEALKDLDAGLPVK